MRRCRDGAAAPLDRRVVAAVLVTQPHRHRAERLHVPDSRQGGDLVEGPHRGRLHEAHGGVLALRDAVLHAHHVLERVDEEDPMIRMAQELAMPVTVRSARSGRRSMLRAIIRVGSSKARASPSRSKRWSDRGGRRRAHGHRGREPDCPPHGLEDAQDHRARREQDRLHDRVPAGPVLQRWKR